MTTLPKSGNRSASSNQSARACWGSRSVRGRARRHGRHAHIDRRARHLRRPTGRAENVIEVASKAVQQEYDEFKKGTISEAEASNAPR